MKINHVHITNHDGSDNWWSRVKQQPDKPLIQATIRLTLSNTEYMELLAQDEKNIGKGTHLGPVVPIATDAEQQEEAL